MKRPLIPAAAPFASLFGRPTTSASTAVRAKPARQSTDEEDPDEQRSDESDEDYARRMAERDDDDDAEDDGEDTDDGDGDEDNPDEDDDERKKKTKKKTKAAAAAARAAERARCRAIFASPHAAGRIATAAHLAFDTNLGAQQAIAVLASVPKDAKGAGLSAAISPYNQNNTVEATARAIIEAGKKRRGEI